MKTNFLRDKKWFTLIELIISITIFLILVVSSYMPYAYYQNKAKLKIATKEISQWIYEARKLSINGYMINTGSTSTWVVNASIWIYLDSENNNEMRIFSFPYSMTGSDINIADIEDITEVWGKKNNIELVKQILFPRWIQISDLSSDSDDYQNIIIIYEAISWSWIYLYDNWSALAPLSDNNSIDIWISYGDNDKDSSMYKTINYYKNTHIVNY